MGQVNATVKLPAAPDRVWEFISSPGTYEQWMTIHALGKPVEKDAL